MTLCQVLSLCVFPDFRYLSKYFAQVYRAQYEAAMLVFFHGTQAWWPENSLMKIKFGVSLVMMTSHASQEFSKQHNIRYRRLMKKGN